MCIRASCDVETFRQDECCSGPKILSRRRKLEKLNHCHLCLQDIESDINKAIIELDGK
jgi:hypothetical protein